VYKRLASVVCIDSPTNDLYQFTVPATTVQISEGCNVNLVIPKVVKTVI